MCVYSINVIYMTNIDKYSNPSVVQTKANKYIGPNHIIYLSTRKNKKYMVKNPYGEWIHFGQIPYKDGTLNDKDRNNRRHKFLLRNAKWANSPKWSPAYLSYYLLWK